MTTEQTFVLSGGVDLSNADTWLSESVAALDSAPVDVVRLDLSRVTFIDSSGLRAVMAMHRHVRAAAADLYLSADPQPLVREVLQLTGLLPILTDPTQANPAASAKHNAHLIGVRTIEEGQTNPAA